MDWIEPNSYLHRSNNTSFLSTLVQTIYRYLPNSLVDNIVIVSGLIKYPNHWPKDLDLLGYVKSEIIHLLKQKRCYLVFDATAEGFSPIDQNWFDILYANCEKYEIDPHQIIFTSSNLKDEETLVTHCKEHNKKPLNLISYPIFEDHVILSQNGVQELSNVKKLTNKLYKEKYFSSLSRVKRQHRIISQFLLCHSNAQDRALMSQNTLTEHEVHLIGPLIERCPKYTLEAVIEWNNRCLPLVIDQTDFNYNWAKLRDFSSVHNQTIFQLVNETHVDDFQNTSMFYSEKTFRPISCFQPFIIFGQQGCNHYLKELGYKLYDDWFDLSFDWEEDYIERFFKILKVIEDTCKKLDSMTKAEQIAWKFKNEEVLLHNYETLKERKYTDIKFKNFVLALGEQINNSRLF